VTSPQSSDPSRHLDPDAAPAAELLEKVHWHIVRGDHLRAGVASRAGAVLSTNALVIAGIALALSLRSQKPNVALVVIAVAVLGCVVFSVSNAALALVTIRSWQGQFGGEGMHRSFLYSYAEIDEETNTFEGFKRRVTTTSSDELLEFALVELWRCGLLHGYRYRKLRIAMRWLRAALVTFLVVAAVSALR
jgi:hypothetical protein